MGGAAGAVVWRVASAAMTALCTECIHQLWRTQGEPQQHHHHHHIPRHRNTHK